MSDRSSFVYFHATWKDGPLYGDVTDDLRRRVVKHKSGAIRGHTWRYNIHRLVYFEMFGTPSDAIAREKRL